MPRDDFALLAQKFAEFDKKVNEAAQKPLNQSSSLLDVAEKEAARLQEEASSIVERQLEQLEKAKSEEMENTRRRMEERRRELLKSLEEKARANKDRAVEEVFNQLLRELGA